MSTAEQAWTYSLTPRGIILDRLTHGDRIYQSPVGELSFTQPERRSLITYYRNDRRIRPEILLELMTEGWVESATENGYVVARRRSVVGRHVHIVAPKHRRPTAQEIPVGVIKRITYHPQSGARAIVEWHGGATSRRPLEDLRILETIEL